VAGATPARRVALQTLRAVRGGELADRALEAADGTLEARDRAFTRELVYGTLRLRGRLDHILACFSTRPLDRLDPDILDVLRLGAYQLTETSGVPSYAAVSESVELARHTAARGADGFVNAVLQSLRRGAGECTFPAFDSDPVAHLTTWGSHPRWIVERWLAHFGAAATRRLVDIDNQRPRLYVRLLGDPAAARQRLAGLGITAEPERVDGRALALEAADVARALQHSPVIVQDPAAGLVASFSAVPHHARVLDLAAAPGGKALALAAERAGSDRFVAAADISARRMARLRQNVARLSRPAPAGLDALPLALVVADARLPPFRCGDVVLIDAPCTGTGTLRRHPDGRWRLQPQDLTALVSLQAELLDAAAGLVAPGGLLVYATCSLEPEENEAQVATFLVRHPFFALEPGPVPDPALRHDDGTLRVLPHQHGYDGAFAARLRRSR
jgi:16S rRNA (cytosine967-C5)-methyltransferase